MGSGGLVFVLGFGFGVFVCVLGCWCLFFLCFFCWGEGDGRGEKKWSAIEKKDAGLTQKKSSWLTGF